MIAVNQHCEVMRSGILVIPSLVRGDRPGKTETLQAG